MLDHGNSAAREAYRDGPIPSTAGRWARLILPALGAAALLLLASPLSCSKDSPTRAPIAPPPPPPPPPAARAWLSFTGWSGLSGDGRAYGWVKNTGDSTAYWAQITVGLNRCQRDCGPVVYNGWARGPDSLRGGEVGLFESPSNYCPTVQGCTYHQDGYPAVIGLYWRTATGANVGYGEP